MDCHIFSGKPNSSDDWPRDSVSISLVVCHILHPLASPQFVHTRMSPGLHLNDENFSLWYFCTSEIRPACTAKVPCHRSLVTSTSLLTRYCNRYESSETADYGLLAISDETYEIPKPLNAEVGSAPSATVQDTHFQICVLATISLSIFLLLLARSSCMQIQEWQNIFLYLFFVYFLPQPNVLRNT